jgi:hypothetical protein
MPRRIDGIRGTTKVEISMNGKENESRVRRLLRRPLGLPVFEFVLVAFIVIGVLVAFVASIVSQIM